jgi:hypothetical protein
MRAAGRQPPDALSVARYPQMIAMTALVTMAIESAASAGVKARTIATRWRAETGSREFRKEQ